MEVAENVWKEREKYVSARFSLFGWLLMSLFLTFSVLVANPKKLLYTVANPARDLLNREKREQSKKSGSTPPTHPLLVRRKIKQKITRRIYTRYADLGRPRVRTSISSARRLGTRPMGVCVCVFFPSILNIKFVGRTSRGHTGGRSHRIFNPPSFCGACLDFCREKDSAIPFPRRP